MEITKPFRFLDLSAELRNLVYTYAFDNNSGDCGSYYPESDSDSSQDSHFQLDHEFGKSLKNDSNEQGFLHLTQVCRQIRAEFRPIYLSGETSAVRMYCERLGPYLDAFYPGWDDSSTDRSDLIGNIFIIDVDEWAYGDVSLTPFFNLLVAAPHMHITIMHNATAEVQFIIELFRPRKQWKKWIHVIEDVSHCFDTGIIDSHLLHSEFHLLFKHDCGLPWVDYGQGPDGKITIDVEDAIDLVTDLGFDRPDTGDDIFRIYVGIQSRLGDRQHWQRII